ncbi:hypothetical protein BG004_006215 [Podila humilis]|nr:hypothetical protein BG004_006215 [Podila humilis]
MTTTDHPHYRYHSKNCSFRNGVFNRDYPFFITLLRYCHRLEKLSLPTIGTIKNDRSVPVLLLDLFSACAKTFQYLDVHDSYASGEAIAAVIQKCASLRGFRWGYNQSDPDLVCDALLAYHRTSLEDIDMSGTYKDQFTIGGLSPLGYLIRKMLCSLPRLRRFEALVTNSDSMYWDTDNYISSIDLKDPSGFYVNWVCKDLEDISLKFIPPKTYAQFMKRIDAISASESNHQAPIFPEVLCTQLRRLKKLKKLCLAVDVDLRRVYQRLPRQDEEDSDDRHMSMSPKSRDL